MNTQREQVIEEISGPRTVGALKKAYEENLLRRSCHLLDGSGISDIEEENDTNHDTLCWAPARRSSMSPGTSPPVTRKGAKGFTAAKRSISGNFGPRPGSPGLAMQRTLVRTKSGGESHFAGYVTKADLSQESRQAAQEMREAVQDVRQATKAARRKLDPHLSGGESEDDDSYLDQESGEVPPESLTLRHWLTQLLLPQDN